MKYQAPLNYRRINLATNSNKPTHHVPSLRHRQIQGKKNIKQNVRNTNLGLVYGFC